MTCCFLVIVSRGKLMGNIWPKSLHNDAPSLTSHLIVEKAGANPSQESYMPPGNVSGTSILLSMFIIVRRFIFNHVFILNSILLNSFYIMIILIASSLTTLTSWAFLTTFISLSTLTRSTIINLGFNPAWNLPVFLLDVPARG